MKDISSSLSVYNSFMVFNKTFRHILYFSLPTICLIWLHNSHAASGTHVPSLMCEWIKPVTFRNCLKSETTTLRSRTCSSCHKMSTTIEITKNYPQTRFSSYSLVFFFFQGIRGGVCVKSPPPIFYVCWQSLAAFILLGKYWISGFVVSLYSQFHQIPSRKQFL